MKRILIFFGGCSSEYAVSLQSAHAVLTHLDRSRFQPLPVGITRSGGWFCYRGAFDAIPADRWQGPDCVPCTLDVRRGARRLLLLDGSGAQLSFDAAFPVLHGRNGEDGTLQGLLELADVPVIGCGTLSSALCMDKDRAHKLAAQAGLKVPRGTVFRRGAGPEAMSAAAEALGYPLFVKPVRSGSSVGVSRVDGPEALDGAAAAAFACDRELLLEEAIPGREVGCAVLGTGALTVGAVDEIQPAGGFFDFTEKYAPNTAAVRCPARIPPETAAEIRAAAETVYRALDCKGFARVDLFLTPSGELYFNEVNTIPGFTAHSRYPTMMRAAGLELTPLLTRLLETEVGA